MAIRIIQKQSETRYSQRYEENFGQDVVVVVVVVVTGCRPSATHEGGDRL